MDTVVPVIAIVIAIVLLVLAVHGMLDRWGDERPLKRLAIIVACLLCPPVTLVVAGWVLVRAAAR